jgi:hypothetical protein
MQCKGTNKIWKNQTIQINSFFLRRYFLERYFPVTGSPAGIKPHFNLIFQTKQPQ